MKRNQLTLRKVNDTIWAFDAVGNCGQMQFKNVIMIVEPLSLNPGVLIPSPNGLRGTKKALALLERERKKLGLETLK